MEGRGGKTYPPSLSTLTCHLERLRESEKPRLGYQRSSNQGEKREKGGDWHTEEREKREGKEGLLLERSTTSKGERREIRMKREEGKGNG